MPQDDLKRKLVALAARVKGSQPTLLEEIRLGLRASEKKRAPTKTAVRQVIAESLEVPESLVAVKLAAHEDSERIIDDIVSLLQNSND